MVPACVVVVVRADAFTVVVVFWFPALVWVWVAAIA